MPRPPIGEKKPRDPGNPKEDAIEVMATVIEPLPERDVSRRAGKQAPGSGAHLGKDAEEFHPHPGGRQSGRRAFAV